MLFVTNMFFMIREIMIVIQHSGDVSRTTLEEADFILSCIGIGGSILSMIFVLIVFNPVFNNMQEDIFLRIGGNRNLWCKKYLNI